MILLVAFPVPAATSFSPLLPLTTTTINPNLLLNTLCLELPLNKEQILPTNCRVLWLKRGLDRRRILSMKRINVRMAIYLKLI
jgi:hypothetical protein